MIKMQVKKSVLILVIIATCLCSYFNALFGDFVWDDDIFIVSNPYMKSFKFLPHYFLNDFWKIGFLKSDTSYYRPLLAASCMLDYIFWGNNPFGYHLTNIIFHILASILVFLLVNLLSANRFIAFVSSLLFSVHPLHTEAVSFISGRVDVLSTAFFLFSLFLFLKNTVHKNILLYCFSFICFAIALFIKEMAVTLPLVLLCVDYFFLSRYDIKKVIKNFPRLHLGFFVILGSYLILRFYVTREFFADNRLGVNFSSGASSYWRIFTVIKILTFYIGLLFFPYELKVEYQFAAANSLLEPVVLIGVLMILFFLYIAINNAKKYPLLSFSIAWFFITILPVSNIIPQGNIFAERYMYLPSVGFCIAIGFLFSWLGNKNIKTHHLNWKASICTVVFLLIVAMGRVTYERNKVWENDVVLWLDAVKKTYNSQKAHANLGLQYYNLNLLDKAIEEARTVLQIKSNKTYYYGILNNLGCIYLRKDLIDEAIKAFNYAIEVSPDKETAYASLAIAYERKGLYKEAIQAALTALEKNPYFDAARYDLAMLYSKSGQIDEAINNYEKYLETNPRDIEVHVDVGYLYHKKGDLQKAKEHWLAALKTPKDYQPAKDALKLLDK